ncbi:hypothetical protein SAMN02910409_1667 [Prevotellaceae bacterium HUN156]|nr:hypothetical protein SAMN02910409_1667 [Prevotellaceae bacterium HUN156]
MTKDVVNTYLKQSICVIAGITLLALLLANLNGGMEQMVTPLCISIVFQLVACIAYGLVWKWVSATSPASIPTLYMAASAFRMFAAVVVVMAYSLLTDDRDSIRLFVVTFLIYYFVILIYDTWYFVKIEKKLKK